jgi:hypothetical protein
VVVLQFTAQSLFNAAIAVPVVGGAFMVALLVGADVRSLLAGGMRAAVGVIFTALVGSPGALAGFILAVAMVAIAAGIVVCRAKAGTMAVLAAGEDAAGEVERPPVRLHQIRRAGVFSLPVVLGGSARLGRRYTTLGLTLGALDTVLGLAYAVAVVAALQLGARSGWLSAWPLAVILATSTGMVVVTGVNLIYDLLQVIVARDDCGLRAAASRLRPFLLQDARQVGGIFGVVLALVVLGSAGSFLAMAGLALVAWVPVVGLIVVPLQAAAWVIRGLVFQYLELAALAAYGTQYRRFRSMDEPGAESWRMWVQRA